MNVSELNQELNDMILAGKGLDAFEAFYADDVVMHENDQKFEGKDVNRKREQEWFGNVEEFHGAKFPATAVNGDVSFVEHEYDVKMKGMPRMMMNQVSVRKWKDGKIVDEHFYYKGAPA